MEKEHMHGKPDCPYCKGTGWIGYEKPTGRTPEGHLIMTFLPQPCSCNPEHKPLDVIQSG
jgi:hypothetical protein